jgi:TPR repeat protein
LQALTGAVSYPTAEPKAEPPKIAPAAPASPQYASSDLTLLLSRGDAMLALGDISAARRLYERAAALGSARAATAVGKTYDPVFLASIRATGIAADRGAAAEWYRKGAALGDREGAAGLARLSRAQ